MTDEPARTPYLGKYTLVLIAGIVALIAANAILMATLGVPLQSGAAAIFPPMIAALIAGQTWARDREEMPENAAAWRFAVAAGAIFLAVQIPIMMLGLAAVGPLSTAPIGLAVGLLAVTTVIVTLVNRWFVMVGAKGVLKQR